jgi:hypothetical protein
LPAKKAYSIDRAIERLKSAKEDLRLFASTVENLHSEEAGAAKAMVLILNNILNQCRQLKSDTGF